MAFILNWFYSKKEEPAASPQEAISKLNDTMALLEKKQEYLENKIKSEIDTAKSLAATNKRAALQSLAKKKRYEKQLQQIDNTLTTLECQKDALDNASSNAEVLKVLQASSNALKFCHEDMNVDKVHAAMDDIHEQQELSKEISDAISSPMGNNLVDEDELMTELLELEADSSNSHIELPDTPIGDISPIKTNIKKQTAEDKELAELMALAE